MVKVQRSRKKIGPITLFLGIFLTAFYLVSFHQNIPAVKNSNDTKINKSKTTQKRRNESIIVDENCRNLPFIRPSGNIFYDSKVHDLTSLEGVDPPFHFGSVIGKNVRYHMGADVAHFKLIKETNKQGLAFDIGANQGFYTYYLASLGMSVHAFEIFESNYKALQHGIFFNPAAIGSRVNVYPIGLGQKNDRFDMNGVNYGGFLKNRGKEGSIQGVTFDCFAYHHPELDLQNVSFVKIDVEGFEIAVLKGMHNSLFNGNGNVNAMIMEVGPKRWNRASVSFQDGVEEMKRVASYFKKSFVILRKSGGHAKSCPAESLSKLLSDNKSRDLDEKSSMFEIKSKSELEILLVELEKHDYDCNFWYE